jgi:preprotein translocase subunit SecA
VVANLRKCFESSGTELINAFEKNITLALIDDSWKEHLREMDDLKQSVQNAVYEQKDPLLIYKFESFELFKQMMERVNREIIAFLCKAEIPIQQTSEVQQAKAPQKTDMAGMRAAKAEAQPAPSNPEQAMPTTAPPKRSEPIRVDPKIGRNDTCPCGSGKKFKNCHGA